MNEYMTGEEFYARWTTVLLNNVREVYGGVIPYGWTVDDLCQQMATGKLPAGALLGDEYIAKYGSNRVPCGPSSAGGSVNEPEGNPHLKAFYGSNYCQKCDTFHREIICTRDTPKAGKNPVEVLHRLWGEAALRPGYDKADWLELQRAIEP